MNVDRGWETGERKNMPGSDRLTALTAALIGVLLLPTAAFAAPERVSVCHRTAAATPEGREWVQLEVSSRSLQHHLAHGDLTPGELIPGSKTHLDADCVPQSLPATEPPSESPQGPETVFAVAYSDMDPSSEAYNPETDILIAKLIDGPDDAADGVVGPGDVVITAQYPKDFVMSEFGDFTVTEHTVTSTNALSEYSCNVDAGDALFVWSSGQGDFDLYQEWFMGLSMTMLHDRRTEAAMSDDEIQINSASPSQPTDDGIDLLGSADPLNHPFVEVEANCDQ